MRMDQSDKSGQSKSYEPVLNKRGSNLRPQSLPPELLCEHIGKFNLRLFFDDPRNEAAATDPLRIMSGL
jgi:hypothetical protein